MKAVTANEAKTQFGDMLMSVQRAPVQTGACSTKTVNRLP